MFIKNIFAISLKIKLLSKDRFFKVCRSEFCIVFFNKIRSLSIFWYFSKFSVDDSSKSLKKETLGSSIVDK